MVWSNALKFIVSNGKLVECANWQIFAKKPQVAALFLGLVQFRGDYQSGGEINSKKEKEF